MKINIHKLVRVEYLKRREQINNFIITNFHMKQSFIKNNIWRRGQDLNLRTRERLRDSNPLYYRTIRPLHDNKAQRTGFEPAVV